MLAGAAGIVPVEGPVGDLPALQMSPPGPGLLVAGYQSTPMTLTCDERAAFERFAAHKDLGEVATLHAARGLPDAGFVEVCTRFSKTLVAIGDGAGSGRGLKTEIVAPGNPYVDTAPELAVLLTYRDAPRADAQIEVFERAADGSVAISTLCTNADGIARIPLTPGSEVMPEAVVLREPSADLAREARAVEETLWANLTFVVPD